MRWADIEVPNDSVDRNSQESSACYPQRTFYPLSDDTSTRNHRITRTNFRFCSTCPSYSQADIYPYAPQPIIRLESTFALLRYTLGGDRPSQTSNHTLSLYKIKDKLWTKKKDGISLLLKIFKIYSKLPPILHIYCFVAIYRSSQGAWGLSV